MQVEIFTKNNREDEDEVVAIIKQLLVKYEIPLFTNKILVEKGVAPHFHPVLTLSTRTRDPLVILKTFVHEQVHWFLHEHPRYQEIIVYLKQHYKDNGECNRYGGYPDSFWAHIVVCFNTRKILTKLVDGDELKYVYEQWQSYPLTEQLVVDKFKKIELELKEYDMVL